MNEKFNEEIGVRIQDVKNEFTKREEEQPTEFPEKVEEIFDRELDEEIVENVKDLE